MNVIDLQPTPECREAFRRNRQKFIPKAAGCYALVSFEGIVLYVGLTNDLRRRFGEHLDSPEKTWLTKKGRAVFFHWLECNDVEKIERTWQNECEVADGALPILNMARSPVAI